MNKEIIVVTTEFSKVGQDVIKTANRKGCKLSLWDHMSLLAVGFKMAFTQKEIAEQLRSFRKDNRLTWAKIVGFATFCDIDSTNMSHAGAYYWVKVEVIKSEAKKAGLV
jgi:hypothetical protein